MNYPKKIKIPSDSTTLELIKVDTTPKTKEVFLSYRYLTGYYHIGSVIKWNENDFNTLVRKGVIAI